jgi:CheY-like chemotaxis protein
MGGKLGVESVPGQGSTFWIEIALPVAEDEAATSGVPVNAIGRRILSVDDNKTNRFIVRELLESWRMEEASAASAREALQLMQSAARQGRHFDAVILDQHMPGTNGNDLLEAIRRDPALCKVGVVMLSSIDAPAALIEGGAPAADAYVLKPAPALTLLDALMTALAASSQRSAPEATPALPEADAPAEPLGSPATTKTLVLLVEDNLINRLVVKPTFADAPIQLLEAHDGAHALEVVAEFHPDLIFMDISMPVMNGLEATRQIRERERAQKLPPTIVGVTAHAMPADRYRCIEAGMDDYISKPIDPDKLRALVAGFAARHEEAA